MARELLGSMSIAASGTGGDSMRETNDGEPPAISPSHRERRWYTRVLRLLPGRVRRLVMKKADDRPMERLRFRCVPSLSNRLLILDATSMKLFASAAYSTSSELDPMKRVFGATFSDWESIEDSYRSALREGEGGVLGSLRSLFRRSAHAGEAISLRSVCVFDCGANATRFFSLESRPTTEVNLPPGYHQTVVSGYEPNRLAIARFASDHSEGPRSFEILFQEGLAVSRFLSGSEGEVAIVMCGNETHLYKVLEVVAHLQNLGVRAVVPHRKPMARNSRKQKMDLSVSDARKHAEVERLLSIYARLNNSFSLPFRVVLSSVTVSCDYNRLCAMWEKAEMRRRLKKHRTGRHLKSFHSTLLSREGLESVIMITNDADTVFASVNAQPIPPDTIKSSEQSAELGTKSGDDKDTKTMDLTLLRADFNRELAGDLRVRVFAKTNPNPSSAHLPRTATKRPEVANAWFHTALLEEPARALFSKGDVCRIRIRTAFDLPAQLDRPRRLAADLDALKLKSDELLFRVVLFFDLVSPRNLGLASSGILEVSLCSSCLETCQALGQSKARCQCGMTDFDALRHVQFPPQVALSARGSDDEEEDGSERDESSGAEEVDTPEEEKREDVEPILGPSAMLLCEMFPHLDALTVLKVLREHGLDLHDEHQFNQAVDALSLIGMETKTPSIVLVKNALVETPMGLAVVEDPDSTCALLDGPFTEYVRSVKVRLPFGSGFFNPTQIKFISDLESLGQQQTLASHAQENASVMRLGEGRMAYSSRNATATRDSPREPDGGGEVSFRQRRRFGIRMDRPPHIGELLTDASGVLTQEEMDAILAQALHEEEMRLADSALSSSLGRRRESNRVLESLPVSAYSPKARPKDKGKGGKKRSHKQSEDESLSKCLVCQHDFVEREMVRTLPCFHRFHAECVDEWLIAKPKCPLCNMDVTSSGDAQGT